MKTKIALLIWTIFLFACSPATTTPPPVPNSSNTPIPLPEETNPIIELPADQPTGPKIIVTVGTPHIDPGPNGEFPVTQRSADICAFSWANSPLDELSGLLDNEVKTLNPDASARASAFGEDCIYSDGHKVFHAIETDFYIDLPVSDLTDFVSFGDWIAQTIPLVNALPPDMIEGPQSGFVEYHFTKTQDERLIVRVPIQTYNETANGKTGEELFRMFYTD